VQQGVVKPVDLADEFRNRAQRCLKLANEALTLEAQTHWLAMTQLWFSLAEHAEGQGAQFFAESAPHLQTGESGDGRSSSEEEGEDNG
jgi:hypothetical protein